MDDRDFSALAAAYRDGDLDTFRVLVESLTRTLVAMAYRYTRDWEWARDLTQETWIKVHERIDRYDRKRPFRPWLLAIHRHGCLDHVRRAWFRREVEEEKAWVRSSNPASVADDPEREVEWREFHQRLLRAMGVLSERQREVFAQVDLEGRDQREAAAALGMKFATLRTTLHFARKRLAQVLRDMEASP